jgi:uncharacterized protein
MSRPIQAHRLNIQSFAQDGVPLQSSTLLQKMERLAQEAVGLQPDSAVKWEARGELRPQSGADDQVWLHLHAEAAVPLACQRCMAPVMIPVDVDQWYRFVATEEIAMAEDDQSEEDLLVMEPQFDLTALIEDELLMALPLVPMHDVCPVEPVLRVGDDALDSTPDEKPNPFAVLSQLKKK